MRFLGKLLTEAATEAVTEAATEAASEAATQASTEAVQSGGGILGAMTGMVDTMDIFMLVLLLGMGVYVLYVAIRLYREQMLFPNKILYPGNCLPEDCTDEGGFIDFIIPRTIILGVNMLLLGIFLGLNSFLLHLEFMWLDIVMLVLPISLFAAYIIVQRKAAKLFW